MNDFNSVSDNAFMNALTKRKTKNIPLDLHLTGKKKREHEIDIAYEAVEGECIVELTEAESRDDVYDLLYAELDRVIAHYDLSIEPEDVLIHFWDVYRLKDAV